MLSKSVALSAIALLAATTVTAQDKPAVPNVTLTVINGSIHSPDNLLKPDSRLWPEPVVEPALPTDKLSIRASSGDKSDTSSVSVFYVKEGRVVWNEGSFYGDITMRVHVTVVTPPNTPVNAAKLALENDISAAKLALYNVTQHDMNDIRLALINSSNPAVVANTTVNSSHSHASKPALIANSTMSTVNFTKPAIVVNTTVITPPGPVNKPALMFNTTIITPPVNSSMPALNISCISQLAQDTVTSFTSSATFERAAKTAKTPAEYLRAFQNLKSSVDLPTFISSKQLPAYDVIGCAKSCDAVSACSGFNIFIERDPVVTPAPDCSNPASRASYRCALFGSFVATSSASNRGKPMGAFQVAIAASNGYNRRQILPNRIDGYTTAVALPGSFDISKTANGTQLLLGPYEPAQCAILCNSRNKAVDPAGTKHCAYFNAFLAVLNTKPVGTFCALYAHVQPQHDAVKKVVGFRGKKYEVAYSYAYALEK